MFLLGPGDIDERKKGSYFMQIQNINNRGLTEAGNERKADERNFKIKSKTEMKYFSHIKKYNALIMVARKIVGKQ